MGGEDKTPSDAEVVPLDAPEKLLPSGDSRYGNIATAFVAGATGVNYL